MNPLLRKKGEEGSKDEESFGLGLLKHGCVLDVHQLELLYVSLVVDL
jgi:hypothetical protein